MLLRSGAVKILLSTSDRTCRISHASGFLSLVQDNEDWRSRYAAIAERNNDIDDLSWKFFFAQKKRSHGDLRHMLDS